MNNSKYLPRRKALFLIIILAFGVHVKTAMAAVQPSQSTELLDRLPPSDIIISIDARKTIDEALPKVLGGSPEILAGVTRDLETFTERTGINPRDFDRIVVGASPRGKSFEMVVLARGERIDASKVVAAGLTEAARGSKSQKENPKEEFQGHTLYAIEGDLVTGLLVTTFDEHTIAFGSPAAVRATLGRSGLNQTSAGNADLIKLATQQSNAILQFAARMPEMNVPESGKFEHDALLQMVMGAIKEFNGSFAIEEGEARFKLRVRTRNAEQAQNLAEQIRNVKELMASAPITEQSAQSGTPADQTNGASSGAQISGSRRGDLPAGAGGVGGQSVVLPGLGLVVAAPSANVIKNMVVESSGDEVKITLNQPLSAIAAPR